MDIYTKWSAVINAIGVKDENKRKFMSVYAEKHREIERIEQEKIPVMPSGWVAPEGSLGGDGSRNTLPISLKALSKIKFEEKIFNLKIIFLYKHLVFHLIQNGSKSINKEQEWIGFKKSRDY